MELKSRRRQKGEQLQAVFQDIKRLMALAYPGHTGSMVETYAIDAFVDALADRDLRKQVLQCAPATLAEAVTWAIRIEAIDESGSTDTPLDKDRAKEPCKDRAYAHLAPENVGGPMLC